MKNPFDNIKEPIPTINHRPHKITNDILDAIHETIPNSKTILLDELAVIDLFMEFYEQIKHGDEEHQRWLKQETEKFIKNTFNK